MNRAAVISTIRATALAFGAALSPLALLPMAIHHYDESITIPTSTHNHGVVISTHLITVRGVK